LANSISPSASPPTKLRPKSEKSDIQYSISISVVLKFSATLILPVENIDEFNAHEPRWEKPPFRKLLSEAPLAR
jgi:hypothetical protein